MKHMKKKLKIAVIITAVGLMLIPDSAYGILGVRRRTARRTAVVVGTTVAATSAASQQANAAKTAQAQQQTAAAQQQAAAAQQQAAAAKKQAAAAEKEAAAAKKETAAAKQETAVAKGLLPLGLVAVTLPEGCVATVVGDVQYYQCGVNYYRAVFQGNNLVYVTAQAK